MSDPHAAKSVAVDDEPKTPMWLPALGAALFVSVGLWWAVTPAAPPVADADQAASASASAPAPTPPPAPQPTPPPQAPSPRPAVSVPAAPPNASGMAKRPRPGAKP
jgi:hypothetical protein